jgi:hypothetical protein
MEWLESVELDEGVNGERSVIWLHFPYDAPLIKSAKAIGAKRLQSKNTIAVF